MKWTTTFVCPFIILMWMLTVFACTPRQQSAVMDCADSLMDARPDSALPLLNTLLPDTNAMSKRDLMRFHLLRTNAQNKCDTVFRSEHAALMHRVCDYYDHASKREANNKMLAHYLLGRCYDDMGEAPAALQEFHNAVDAADTTRTDCDFRTLSRAYGQMARLFYYHNLFDEQLSALEQARIMASQDHDSLSMIVFSGKIGEVLAMTGRLDSAISISKSIREEYLQHNDTISAARESGYLASLLADKHCFEGIEPLFREYEVYSGYFDSSGNIESGRELYYVNKGQYYLSRSILDSAYLFFLKALDKDISTDNRLAACGGMSILFQQVGNKDSIIKYKTMESACKDTLQQLSSTDQIHQAQKVYIMNRYKQHLERKSHALHIQRITFIAYLAFTIVLLLICLYFGTLVYYRLRKQKMEKENRILTLETIIIQKEKAQEEHEQEMAVLKEMNLEFKDSNRRLNETIAAKQRQLEANRASMEVLVSEIDQLRKNAGIRKVKEEVLMGSRIVQLFHAYEESPLKKPSQEEWVRLRQKATQKMPFFYKELVERHHLSSDNYDICILLRLGFSSKTIANIKGLRASSLSTRLRTLHTQVFGCDGSSRDFIKYVKSFE